MTEIDQVGCNCDVNPVQTTLPVIVFQAPASGIICVGVFLFIATVLGCVGAIREQRPVLIAYGSFLLIIVVMQFGFGTAAAAVAGGSAPAITGPFMGILNENYKYFDWKMLDYFFPSACYYSSANTTLNDPFSKEVLNLTFHYPACDFYGKCANFYAGSAALNNEELYCCDLKSRNCDTSKVNCMSGYDCVMNFMGKVAAPVAVVAFLALTIEIAALVCCCVVLNGGIYSFSIFALRYMIFALMFFEVVNFVTFDFFVVHMLCFFIFESELILFVSQANQQSHQLKDR